MTSMYFEQLGQPTPPPPDVLKQIFKLTDQEIRVASYIVRGKTLKTAASEMALTHETIRNHLRRIFHKTDTHSQSELVVLLFQAAK